MYNFNFKINYTFHHFSLLKEDLKSFFKIQSNIP